jgi:hypothetical protein
MRLNPSLLQHASPPIKLYDEKEKEECKEVEENDGYYGKGAISQYATCDLRQICRDY